MYTVPHDTVLADDLHEHIAYVELVMYSTTGLSDAASVQCSTWYIQYIVHSTYSVYIHVHAHT